MFRIGEVVYDSSLNKEVKVTPELQTAMRAIPEEVVKARWQSKELVEDAVIVEEVVEEVKEEGMSLEEAKKAYKEKHGKEVPNRYKNKLNWIVGKL